MKNSATEEFIIGFEGDEGCEKYTPRNATYNGIKGRIWTKRILENGCWAYQYEQHVRSAANKYEVTAAFGSDVHWSEL